MANKKQSGLGRGIEALFEENNLDDLTSQESVQDIELTKIRPNPYQPRRTFDQKALKELAASIKKSGVFQPVILRQPDPKLERYELIAGERRFRASKLAKQKTIPAIVRSMSDEKMMEVAVLENLQREDLTPLEEAQAYQTLMNKLDLTQAQVATRLGKSRPYIANYLRLLGLPPEIKKLVSGGQLSMGQARTILGLKDRKKLVSLAKRAVDQNITVRQLEDIVAKMNGNTKKKTARRRRKPAYARAAESELQSKFGTKVAVAPGRKRNTGKIEIPYTNAEDFDRIMKVLNISLD
ncbi:stage 0 DNA-binding protein [Limosilactobacillus frumenti DSM 13145]|uniref:Stage 0 DNA-binding protein n=1 Tax=Limosilactobacillus frumenti DSM 13145 TaxID=1423746 RepID=A0A0R1PCN3_9LACO|nr:ParB/RepB/Spo0J family partition protein [Limosilactobacillus frumenti]KRL27906.1 stage 0 DNA-binding protein [Limosilactobacillus frumenti DSM 13145]QFG71931.1 ParB/RepB/Spo0J family partition protein [Limosilactobacillus frumenti]